MREDSARAHVRDVAPGWMWWFSRFSTPGAGSMILFRAASRGRTARTGCWRTSSRPEGRCRYRPSQTKGSARPRQERCISRGPKSISDMSGPSHWRISEEHHKRVAVRKLDTLAILERITLTTNHRVRISLALPLFIVIRIRQIGPHATEGRCHS